MIIFPIVKGKSTTKLSLHTRMDLDFQTCQQMRKQGISEDEIKSFVDFYDKDHTEHIERSKPISLISKLKEFIWKA